MRSQLSRGLLAVALAGATLLGGAGIADAAPAAGQKPVDDYKGHWGQTYGFAKQNCTAFAAYRIVHRLGVKGFKNQWKGQVFGDAGHWDNAARAAKLKVDNKPAVGAIAVNDVHKVGHVAYVNKVNSNGSFDVEEYNWNNPLHYGTRKGAKHGNGQAKFQHFIHFK
ncbi:CHAP domain-containing protein [Sciscionella sediminilitoris]|uniref:CHAP domain-containing protein n=1 Tax=Sciscionella sediminilitoris TaxID=1445613 RepID=UPI00068FAEC3|nr:CHAP domain-containing protein [Sciscionella sp. SE31]